MLEFFIFGKILKAPLAFVNVMLHKQQIILVHITPEVFSSSQCIAGRYATLDLSVFCDTTVAIACNEIC